jgi:L-asparaginase II
VLAEVIRSGFGESLHRGSVVMLGPGGEELLAAGEVAAPMYPRSCNKPMQAAAMTGCGLRVRGELLALAAGSHSGEDYHVSGVREILAAAGLTEHALRCPPALPREETDAEALLRSGGQRSAVYMNCSGKHAAMLATCVAAGWPTESYLDPGHPLQRETRRVIARLSGEEVAEAGVDGCGAPLFAISLAGLARAYRQMVLAARGTAEREVADQIRAHPAWMSGTQRPERALMAAVPGLLVKPGAEGVQALALPDGRAAAVKIEDGSSRAIPALTVAILRRFGVGHGEGDPRLDQVADTPVFGGGRVVGQVRAVLPA